MLRIAAEHTHLIGCLAKLTELGVELECEYEEIFNIGNKEKARFLKMYCDSFGDKYELWFIFIDEPPIKKGSLTWYCLKEVGKGVSGDWHWFTLDQLIICKQ